MQYVPLMYSSSFRLLPSKKVVFYLKTIKRSQNRNQNHDDGGINRSTVSKNAYRISEMTYMNITYSLMITFNKTKRLPPMSKAWYQN